MKPQLLASRRVFSEKRAAASRANGAKSRGPVTAQGRANSSRNRLRHGLRAQNVFVDRESADHLTALLASYEREFQPRSEMERTLIEAMALAAWRRTCLWRLETAELTCEFRRLELLTPDENPTVLLSFAFGNLSVDGGPLNLIYRLEACCERHFERALDRLTALRAGGIFEKINTSERTQEVTENTEAESASAFPNRDGNGAAGSLAGSIENLDPPKIIMIERTRQPLENRTPHFEPAAFSPGLIQG